LYETGKRLGGQALIAQLLPGRAEFGGLIGNLENEISRYGVAVKLNTAVTRELIQSVSPSAVVIATGAQPRTIEGENFDGVHRVEVWDLLQGNAHTGNRVVVVDWRCDWIGMGVAEMLARDGCHVRLAVNGSTAGENVPMYARFQWLGTLHKLGVEIIPYARLCGADEDTVYLQNSTSDDPMICEGVDTLVTSLGHVSNTQLENQLQNLDCEIHLAGDCLSPRTAEEAVLEGMQAGVAIN
jgi:pyruvate/2-oxoglutarate dehydrogenase complex dihydrolipoamide dehydrogenase (E3) component